MVQEQESNKDRESLRINAPRGEIRGEERPSRLLQGGGRKGEKTREVVV